MREGVTLVVPSIPPRKQLLVRALTSAYRQDRPFSDVITCIDLDKEGAGPTRTRGMRMVDTRWTAFLDDDDELYPNHLAELFVSVEQERADVVFPWFDVVGGSDPFPQFFGREFDSAAPHMFPITVLVRTELLVETGGFRREPSRHDASILEGEDWVMWLELIDLGAKIVHRPVRTWRWHHDSGNTSGLPSRW